MVIDGFPRIEIYGSPGLYLLEPESATGKTYLFNVLRKAADSENGIFTYTLGDPDPVPPDNTVIAMADRGDWYRYDSRIMDVFKELSKRAIVLMDIKNSESLPYEFRFSTIIFNSDSFEVYCDSYF